MVESGSHKDGGNVFFASMVVVFGSLFKGGIGGIESPDWQYIPLIYHLWRFDGFFQGSFNGC